MKKIISTSNDNMASEQADSRYEDQHSRAKKISKDEHMAQVRQSLLPDLLELMERVNHPLKLDEILRVGDISRKHKKFVQEELRELVESRKALRLSGGSYFSAAKLVRRKGVLQIQRAGMGFVIPDKGEGEARRAGKKSIEDIYIHPEYIGEAWNGDRVEVVLLPDRRGGRRKEGQIIAILERARKELLVRVAHGLGRSRPNEYIAVPLDERLHISLLVDASNLPVIQGGPKSGPDGKSAQSSQSGNMGTLRPGTLLMVKLGERLEGDDPSIKLWSAQVTELFDERDDIKVQERLVKANNNISVEFPEAVLQEAAEFPENPSHEDFQGREDLRRLGFVTIDGPDSKDFDDAILVQQIDAGFCLQVAIADVAHYVRPDSHLDREAGERGNSCYFPTSVEPMLPEALSNKLCSLNPQVPRLVMLARVFFDHQGNVLRSEFAEAVIQSHARLVYDNVFLALRHEAGESAKEIIGEEVRQGLEAVEEMNALSPGIMPMLRQAKELALLLKAKRKARGSLDFDLSEPKAIIDSEGRLVDLGRREQNFAHQLIEEFMLAANEAVARFLHERQLPALYRNHAEPDPEKLDALFNVLAGTELGLKLPAKIFREPGPQSIGKLLEVAKGTPQEFITSRLTLRSMMQARYSPELEGHFGLASQCYCHFTSPIRRYADLVVHRSLKAALGKSTASAKLPDMAGLTDVADHINVTERAAVDAEREIYKRLGVLLLRDKIGEVYTGVVSGVTDFGMFIELNEIASEGMVRVASLKDDYYDFFPERYELRGTHHGRIFRLGMPLTVQLAGVDHERLEVTLTLVENCAEELERDGAHVKHIIKRGKLAIAPVKESKSKGSKGNNGGKWIKGNKEGKAASRKSKGIFK